MTIWHVGYCDCDRCAVTEFLADINLSQYQDAIEDLGVTNVYELRDVHESDLIEIGIKRVEARRFLRSVAELPSQKQEQT